MGDQHWTAGHPWRETESVTSRHCWWLWEANGAEGVGGVRQEMWMAWSWERMWGTETSTESGRAGILQCAMRVFRQATCSAGR